MVALREAKRPRDGDFNFCVPGELVRFPFDACDCPDCGCDRAMAGMASSKGTTIFEVRERPDMTIEEYRLVFLEALSREGWLKHTTPKERLELNAWIDEHLDEANRFKAGDEPR
jgi:hypothetical protein